MGRNFAIDVIMRMKSNFESALKKQAGALKGAKAGTEKLDKALDKFQRTLTNAITVIAPAGIAAAFVFATFRAGAFDQQLQRVAVTMDATAKRMGTLRRGLFRVSGITGKTTEDLGKISEMAGQAGFASELGAKGMVRFANTLGKFNEVANIGATEGGRIFTRLTDQLKLLEGEGVGGAVKALRIKRLASAIQIVGKNSVSGAAEVARFTEAMLPLRQTTKITVAQMLGIAGAARSFGRVTSELLASQPQRIFQRALIDRGAQFAQVMGMSEQSLTKLINTDPVEFLLKLFTSLGRVGKTASDFNKVTERLGINNLRLVPILAGARFQVKKIREQIARASKELAGAGETLDKDFNRIMDTFNKQLVRARVNMDNLAKTAGQPFLRPMTASLKVVNFVTGSLVTFGQTAVGQFLAATLAITPLVSLWRVLATLAAGSSISFGVAGSFFSAAGVKAVIGAVFVALKTLAPVMATTLAIAAAIVAVFKLGAFTLTTVFGPGVVKFVENLKLLSRTFFQAFETGRISGKDFLKLMDRDLFNTFLGLLIVAKKGAAFIGGFAAAFDDFGKTLARIGEPFLVIVNAFFSLLDILGILPATMKRTGNDFRDLGIFLGSMVRAPFEVLAFVADAVTAKIRGLIGLLRDSFNMARPLLNLLIPGFGAATSGIRPLGPGIRNTLPLGAEASAGAVGETTRDTLIAAIRQIRQGAAIPSGGAVGIVDLNNSVTMTMDGDALGKVSQRRRVQTRKRQGAVNFGRAATQGVAGDF